MTNRLVDPLRLERPVSLERSEADDRTYAFRADGSPKRRASGIAALLAMLVAALVLVPVALADDDDDDGGSTPAALGPNIVVNGDFELPVICPVGFSPTPPASWTLEEGTVDIVCITFWQPATGAQSVDLTGTPGQGTISQNLATQSGERYRLRFALSGNPDRGFCVGEPTTKQMVVRWGGTAVATVSFDASANTRTNMGWVYHEFVVEATGTPTELEFESLTGTFCGPVLDDVSVQQLLGGDDDDDDDDGDDDDDDGDDDE